MYRQIVRLVPILALLVVAGGCGNNDSTPTTPEPTPDKQDSFQGILTLNGAAVYPFTVNGPSSITAQLVSLSPDTDKVIGMSLGTWNGSICQIVLDNPATRQGDVVEGATQVVGDFCLRVYDPNGSIDPAQFYAVIVTHQ